MNVKQQYARGKKMQAKNLKLREKLWADVPDEELWLRLKQKGFTTIPRTMPIIVNIIDALTKNAAAGYTYFCLWCRSFDAQVIDIPHPADLAAESGFSGERAVSTWRQRMKALKEHGFIMCEEGTHDYQYVLLLNPHKVIQRKEGEVPKKLFAQLLNRAFDVGARDMTEEEPASEATGGSKD
ncbi:hypothetical protein [Mesoterricola sediminis]|uniref:Replication protein n=1 Tax=Mesoterricola sediminis TaxID=2927980 RepID=A0AA48HED1_9BACT|nr:hypothetical protein [Mesoterricola sediminis]BDU76713.1 hypothetical protein METESE_16710 [Mesoterricola sediminis]